MILNINGGVFDLSSPKIMGVLNVTPDSFYDGGVFSNEKKILAQVEKMILDGADIIDIGGFSSKPGAKTISLKEEEKRVIPIIKLINKTFNKISLSNIILGISFLIVWSIIIYKLYIEFQATETEVPITWFAILNSLFIIIFAPLFTKWWDSKYNPPASVKYGLGLIIMAIGFGLLAYATKDIPLGAKTAKLSMIWLVLAYLFHTLGELCLSPMGLSYLSKLVPARMVAFMFGVYYLAIAIGNKLAHYIGGDIEKISQESGLSYFFLIFTIVPIVLGLVSFALHPLLKKLMHGVR
jgi:POT family proton-dependent oligopeptide transporter